MAGQALALGVDLGSSGLRLALTDPQGTCVATATAAYPEAFANPRGWREGLIGLCQQLPAELRARVGALAVDGTSGTLLLCRPDGALAPGPLAEALPYYLACPEQAETAARLAGSGAAASPSGSLARALRLLSLAQQQGLQGAWL
ncbi:MAG: sugar kinase, partial [Cyanobacteria bacterium]|nr:sugar kinase [Cyanobacteriota bacterium]